MSFPYDLPRIDVEYDLTPEEKLCQCGCIKSRIGTEVSEQLDIIPAKMQVIRIFVTNMPVKTVKVLKTTNLLSP